MSVKRPVNSHLQNVRQSWAENANPDSMIVGGKNGPVARQSAEHFQAPSFSVQKPPPLNVQK
jgi:hypothetical protein